jgi:hypothetical protein
VGQAVAKRSQLDALLMFLAGRHLWESVYVPHSLFWSG